MKCKAWMYFGVLAVSGLLLGGCQEKEDAYIVRIEDGKMSYEVEESEELTVGDIFEECGIELRKGDEVSMDVDRMLAKNTDIRIDRLVSVNVRYDGKDQEISLCGSTVKDAIESAKVPVPKKEYVNFALDAPLEAGMKIVVNKVQVRKEKEEKAIPFKSVEQETGDLIRGETRVSQEGVDGVRTITYQVTYVDGKEKARKKVKNKVTQEPVDEIILIGTAEPEPEPEPEYEDDGGDDGGSSEPERTVVSSENFDDCDGSGHGVTITTYSDGSTEETEY